MIRINKTLFGGALLTAGVVANAAAQEFTLPGNVPPYADTYVQGTVYDYYTVGTLTGDSTNGGFPDSYAINSSSGSTLANITVNSLSAYASGAGNTDFLGFSSAISYVYVSVTLSAALEMAWDFTQEAGFAPAGLIRITDWSAGGVTVFETAADSAGTDSFNLTAGNVYGILLIASAGQEGTGFAEANLVPSPGSLGLIGLAGIAAVRRRR
ncbi:MAG: PEP-CTERM sorting domain-containing protein [Planctomycetota bacterium]